MAAAGTAAAGMSRTYRGDEDLMENEHLGGRGRALEDEYFRKRDRELADKMRQAAAAQEARQQLGLATGLSDPALLQELEELRFTPETVSLLPLVPILEVAWAEGGVSAGERTLLVQIARSRGIAEGSAADRQLADWMSERPSDEVFARAGRLTRALLDAEASPVATGLSADELVAYAETIAATSGGLLGMGKVSAEEKALLATLSETLQARRR
jgi:hypothetical protein